MRTQWAKLPFGDKLFDVMNITLMISVMIICVYPLWYSFIGALNDGTDYKRGGVFLIPRILTLDNYKVVFSDTMILDALMVTVGRTFLGTACALLVLTMFSYAFSHLNLKFRNGYAILGMVTMYFSGGLIPTYILYVNIGLINNFLVYILPSIFSFFNVLIMIAFFRAIPEALKESARIDGATEYGILFKIILPLSKPLLATIALFEGVNHWNNFTDTLMFTTSLDLQTVQAYLMKIIKAAQFAEQLAMSAANAGEAELDVSSTTIQYATMMVATIPIVLVYPFLQKYFIKGVLIGSVKG